MWATVVGWFLPLDKKLHLCYYVNSPRSTLSEWHTQVDGGSEKL